MALLANNASSDMLGTDIVMDEGRELL